MHDAARDYVKRYATTGDLVVYEIGSRDINGEVRDLFPNADYTGLDLSEGPGVDVVADASTWRPKRRADVVVCCEVFEHTADWPKIVANVADRWLKAGGKLVVTAAAPGRKPHSAVDGGPLRNGEHYANLTADELEDALTAAGFDSVDVEIAGLDVRACGVK